MNTELLLDSLKIMGFGMGGIFIVIIVIMLVVVALNKMFADKE
jgi:hypothetical protein